MRKFAFAACSECFHTAVRQAQREGFRVWGFIAYLLKKKAKARKDGQDPSTCSKDICPLLRVHMPDNHVLAQILYYDYDFPIPKDQLVGS